MLAAAAEPARSRGRSPRLAAALALGALAAAGCFRLVGPEDPPPVETPLLVSVRVEYRQPGGCTVPPEACSGPVVFFATWKQEGSAFALARIGDSNVWAGVAESVPVNYPPRDEPYAVRVFDPFLVGDALRGITANRITVGGEQLIRFANIGDEDESALVYVDEDGNGHNAF
jgi:hypothetical protein